MLGTKIMLVIAVCTHSSPQYNVMKVVKKTRRMIFLCPRDVMCSRETLSALADGLLRRPMPFCVN
jgi:hypothetical protein